MLARLLPHTLQRLQESWQRQLAPGAGGNGRAAAEADVVQERLLRELTREVAELLTGLLEPSAPTTGVKTRDHTSSCISLSFLYVHLSLESSSVTARLGSIYVWER